jgi:hypothetical protein
VAGAASKHAPEPEEDEAGHHGNQNDVEKTQSLTHTRMPACRFGADVREPHNKCPDEPPYALARIESSNRG